ncbi:hypothetical protein DSO57_1025998 [Entomophthora muscae]|uniref:Uncharacterized protein n=1 Tax=Entomophthora muscae TaxID=34485 RepID=A0ACC2S453_9FUNG|nr:hypothetical protein DSO57_1025998 [Entomophthora muscae]
MPPKATSKKPSAPSTPAAPSEKVGKKVGAVLGKKRTTKRAETFSISHLPRS